WVLVQPRVSGGGECRLSIGVSGISDSEAVLPGALGLCWSSYLFTSPMECRTEYSPLRESYGNMPNCGDEEGALNCIYRVMKVSSRQLHRRGKPQTITGLGFSSFTLPVSPSSRGERP